MNIINLLRIALKALANNKMRGFLTMLGIIIGVASVIMMLAIGQGAKTQTTSSLSELGTNQINIQPGGDMMRGGVRQSSSSMESLKLSDYESILKESRYLTAASPVVSTSGQVVFGSNNKPSTVYGVNCDYLEIRRFGIDDGDMFTEHDINSAAKVCVVGKTVVDELFPNGENPVGQVIRFKQIPFQIVGVLKSKGHNSIGMDQDDIILAPYTTIQKRVLAITHIQSITASVVKEEYTDDAMDEIAQILRANHKLKADDPDDFNVSSMKEFLDTMTTVIGVLTLLLAAVAGISLVVGGLGIMNIMYVSVTERTREIGLRMSIGARGKDILSQFLIESILISITGGLIGVLSGIGISMLIRVIADFPVGVQAWSVVLSFAVCTITGIFFGWYPAKKAAQLDPIEAIRYE
jgi:putative ABC transport system permease protein